MQIDYIKKQKSETSIELFEGGQSQNVKQSSVNRQTPQQNQNNLNQEQIRNNQSLVYNYNNQKQNHNELSNQSGRNKRNQQNISQERNNIGNIGEDSNMQYNKQQNLNLVKNSKNRKLYTSIGAYNNNGNMINQGTMSIIDSNLSINSGFNNVGGINQIQKQIEIISFSGQNTTSNIQKNNNDNIIPPINPQASNQLYNALAQSNIGKFANFQQRNLIISQQQSLKNKVKLQTNETDQIQQIQFDNQKQNQQKQGKAQNESSQNVRQIFNQHQQIIGQQNNLQMNKQMISNNQQGKQKNKSFNEVGNQNDMIIKGNSNDPKFQSDQITGHLQQNSNVFQLDPQQRKYDLIHNINQNQIQVYKSMIQQDILDNTTDLISQGMIY